MTEKEQKELEAFNEFFNSEENPYKPEICKATMEAGWMARARSGNNFKSGEEHEL